VPREYLGTPQDQGWKEPLIDNRRSPVRDQAAFRIDFPRWLQTLPERDRDIVLRLCQGERPVEVARQYGITRGRVSQLRRELHDGWLQFHGELPVSGGD
jgi:DNA-directed RNA polymerase specialized sigma subunit